MTAQVASKTTKTMTEAELGDSRLVTAFHADDAWTDVLVAQTFENTQPYTSASHEDVDLYVNDDGKYVAEYEGDEKGDDVLDMVLMGLINKGSIWNTASDETMVQANILLDSGYTTEEVADLLVIETDEEKGKSLIPAVVRANGEAEPTGYE